VCWEGGLGDLGKFRIIKQGKGGFFGGKLIKD